MAELTSRLIYSRYCCSFKISYSTARLFWLRMRTTIPTEILSAAIEKSNWRINKDKQHYINIMHSITSSIYIREIFYSFIHKKYNNNNFKPID